MISYDKSLNYFSLYYRSNHLIMPDLISKREIGYIPFSGTMIRHLSFRNHREIESFVKRNTPRHLYYSSAYYIKPDEKRMEKKIWEGAELIFDLDADHIPGSDKMTYEEILLEVKKHVSRLLNYLINDFGFDDDSIKLYFSGGRGYHVHVVSDRVYSLDSDARREIGNYIKMEDFTIDNIIRASREKPESGPLKRFNEYISEIYSDENYLKRFYNGDFDRYYKSLDVYKDGKKKIDIMRENNYEKFKIVSKRDLDVLNNILNDFKDKYSAEIDEPVTTDVHRLIRFPGSLHGKTGLAVTPVNINEFDNFDPLISAVPEVFKDKYEHVYLNSDYMITMMNEKFSLNAGENKVPLYLALFLTGMKIGNFIEKK
ncbi:DNA primase small subunit PriS [Picrophilus oshimae]|uniref:DNA primase small subunit PriS n=1 Tax=Picrophilus torridus (strain ATCC 700027 / DSM 9790 / JCM 10055 / NBRC 100828 / KAW 2/3) TaxID=1122961 RepID=PRIS_PICTO|nr:DNA primase small subunit PriS [Picrophilus oshimae]Q6L0W5.1 RecName: Full=DNA primase small subunit PriS [Picrophilus oshimae DSM 9789]AAT43387.1 DNA primase small subunit [Picrophilus oshimae DSM 9789]